MKGDIEAQKEKMKQMKKMADAQGKGAPKFDFDRPEAFFDIDRTIKSGTMVTKNMGALNKLTAQATKMKMLQSGVQRKRDQERYEMELMGYDVDKPGTFVPPSVRKAKFKSTFLQEGNARSTTKVK